MARSRIVTNEAIGGGQGIEQRVEVAQAVVEEGHAPAVTSQSCGQ